MYDNFIEERPTETTKRGIMIVYGILKYNDIFLQFYSWNDELVNKIKYDKNMHW